MRVFACAREGAKLTTEHLSIVKASLPFLDLMGGEVVHQSFDVPKNLRNAFKQATRSSGTTVCYVLQSFMCSYVVSHHYQKECFNNTQDVVNLPNKVVIENLEIPSYEKQRSRRRDFTKDKKVCFVDGCDVPGVTLGVWTVDDTEWWACGEHVKSVWLKDKRWSVF